ncbi:hypothetical protein DFH09DRAFT_1039670 [Mycena vulgaris]|nr:hypothetical protein DFH09DRAFT_1039670 [Mycena vulgaris]
MHRLHIFCMSSSIASTSTMSPGGPPPDDGLAPAHSSPKKLRLRTKIQREDEILGRCRPPHHWRAPNPSPPFGWLRRIVFDLLCIISFGHAGLEPIWAAIKLEEEGDEGIDQICDRLNNILLVGSLLLATSAAFITTTPPRESIVNYTLRGPYICMLGSFGLLIGGIIVASGCVLVAKPYWSEQVLYADRFHVYCTLLTLSYPFVSIGGAALLLAFGMQILLVYNIIPPDVGHEASSLLYGVPKISECRLRLQSYSSYQSRQLFCLAFRVSWQWPQSGREKRFQSHQMHSLSLTACLHVTSSTFFYSRPHKQHTFPHNIYVDRHGSGCMIAVSIGLKKKWNRVVASVGVDCGRHTGYNHTSSEELASAQS